MSDAPNYTNRLIHEKSPYLLQHAHNPVDWYPWGKDAFEKAQHANKPIFLSIGYATCHWCHVMEKESFEDVDLARRLNETFVNVKVDREELPEVDGLYMEFAQSMMAGAAGWPLNVILTPDLQPIFAATYLPPRFAHGLMGMEELIEKIQELWHGDERDRVIDQSQKIVEVFADSMHSKGELLPEREQIDETAELLYQMADPVFGGLKGIPKFPIGYQANFMLRYSAAKQDSRALFLVERTLDMMHRGGIYDHLGGGFSRYSVDERWLIPHFEKMLYDNAILSYAYLEAWRATKKPLYRQVCQEVLDYILREMTHPEGGFYSAEDSDSEGKEGYYYTWSMQEIEETLGKRDAQVFCEFYDVTQGGNFEKRNILHTEQSIEEFSGQQGADPEELTLLLKKQREVLADRRNQREHPFKDDKILSSWNGLMIYSMVEAGASLNHRPFLEAAVKAARFIQEEMWENGQLLRRWRDGQALHRAGLDEYAFLIRGLISLFEMGCGNEWLAWALEMTEILEIHFKDEEGAFFQVDGHDPHLILRRCHFSDGAEPSGNAVHCENLLRLYHLTLDRQYFEQAEDILRAVKKFLDSYSPGYGYHVMNLLRYYDRKVPEVVIALNREEHLFSELHHAIFQLHLPHRAVIWRKEGDEELFNLLPFTKQQEPIEGKTTLYLCYEGVCHEPLTDFSAMLEALHKI